MSLSTNTIKYNRELMLAVRRVPSHFVAPLLGSVKPAFRYLPHEEMDKVKKALKLSEPNKHPLLFKIKYLWRQTKYTLVQGHKDLWNDAKWAYNTWRHKPHKDRTGYQLTEMRRIRSDLLKFIPYSFFIVVPLSEFLLPLYLYLFPNSIPSFFKFDTAYNKQVHSVEQRQEEAFNYLQEKLMMVMRDVAKSEAQFLDPTLFKKNFYQVYYEISKNLNYRNMSSDDLIQVARFLDVPYFTGVESINKIFNIFSYYLPTFTLKLCRWSWYKLIARRPAPEFTDPFLKFKSPRFLKFNYFPFEYVKRRFILFQIDQHLQQTKLEDEACLAHGIKDLKISDIKDFSRARGITSITCYEALKQFFKREWLAVTTHPKFDPNTKIWYSVMIYHFLKDRNRELL